MSETLLPQPEIPAFERENQKLKRFIRIFSYITVGIALVVIIVALAVPSTLTADRKIYVIDILGVCSIGILIVILVSLTESITLLIFSALSTYISFAIVAVTAFYYRC